MDSKKCAYEPEKDVSNLFVIWESKKQFKT
jgi:hypothetical protein